MTGTRTRGRAVPFEKWEGLGNDFVLMPAADLDDAAVARICDRRRGVGADGVLLVSGIDGGEPAMVVRNADGGRPEMCGNGIRCVAGMLALRGEEVSRLTIRTDSGPKECGVVQLAGEQVDVTVDMGTGRIDGDLVVEVDGRAHRFARVDVGNPHAVTFEPYDDAAVDRVGPAVSIAPPAGTNVEFCSVVGDRIRVVVWERGVGRTLACGTGACAVALLACETGRSAFDQPLEIELPGGVLTVVVGRAARRLVMRGPARRVFAGELVIA
jgi:diaminopimelate epimerase